MGESAPGSFSSTTGDTWSLVHERSETLSASALIVSCFRSHLCCENRYCLPFAFVCSLYSAFNAFAQSDYFRRCHRNDDRSNRRRNPGRHGNSDERQHQCVPNGTTNTDGSYRFAFVTPGTYRVTVTASGFQSQTQAGMIVSAGQPTTVNIQLAVAGALPDRGCGGSGNRRSDAKRRRIHKLQQQMIENLPNPGGDITYFAQTAPGVVMNTDGGNGNFSARRHAGNIQSVHHQWHER